MGRTHDVIISGFDLSNLENQLAAVTEQRDRYKLACDQYSEDETMNSLQSLKSERDRLETILKDCLYEMPVGYIPNHTIENLPDMIASQAQLLAEEITHSEKLVKQRDLLIEVLEVTLNATVLNHRRDRWHSDAEYALHKIKLNLK